MTEYEVQAALADYVKYRYPSVIFHSDFGSGLYMSIGQATRQKRLNGGRRAFPDFQICKACNGYNGLFLELKRPNVRVYRKDGTIVQNEHIREQAELLERLRKEGYYAEFAVGLDEALLKVDRYLKD